MDNQTLLSRADHCLATADYRPQRLALWHSGLAAAVTLLSSLVNYLLTNQMDASAGLSGLELRTALRGAAGRASLRSGWKELSSSSKRERERCCGA